MYKLVAIDLDGTLLNSYGQVTENTIKSLKNITENGIQVVLASGRNLDSMKAIATEIENIQYLIAGNGSIVYDIKEDKIIYDKYIQKPKVINIAKMCEKNSIYYNVYTSAGIITNSLKYNVLYYYKENLKKEDSKRTNIKVIKNINEYLNERKDVNILKICVCDENKNIFKSIIKKIRDLEDLEILDIEHQSKKIIQNGSENIPVEYFFTEISEKNVDKWNALNYLIENLNIKKEEVIAIGDNVNDKQMIKNAGYGVAMKGSTPEISQFADLITDYTNDEEGVAKFLNFTEILQKY